MAIDACGWYPAMEAIRITDDPFLRCGAAACNNKNSTSTPPSKKKKKLWNLSIEKHRTHLQQQNRSLHIDVPKLIEDRLSRLQYVIYRRIGRRIGHNYIYMTIFLQQNPQLILKKIKLLPLNLKQIVSFSFTWTVFSMRSFRCWGFETWQTTPKTSIPLDLSLSTASSTFLYSSKGGKKKNQELIQIGFVGFRILTCFREETTTEAPSRPNRSAMANPIPWVDAITIATLPCNLFIFSQFFFSVSLDLRLLFYFPYLANYYFVHFDAVGTIRIGTVDGQKFYLHFAFYHWAWRFWNL